jgi:hypothetical protein
MNQRIQEIAEQVFNEANDGSIDNIKIPKEFIEKFAESIVQECALIINNDGRFLTYTALEKKIKKHFGIKE